jgi:hypothetical protein
MAPHRLSALTWERFVTDGCPRSARAVAVRDQGVADRPVRHCGLDGAGVVTVGEPEFESEHHRFTSRGWGRTAT